MYNIIIDEIKYKIKLRQKNKISCMYFFFLKSEEMGKRGGENNIF